MILHLEFEQNFFPRLGSSTRAFCQLWYVTLGSIKFCTDTNTLSFILTYHISALLADERSDTGNRIPQNKQNWTKLLNELKDIPVFSKKKIV